MFFSSTKWISKGIKKYQMFIYLKVTIGKNWHSQNFFFLGLKNLSPGQIAGIIEF